MPPSGAPAPTPIPVERPITLGQFVKLAGLAATGGDAKRLVVSGLVRVNGEIDTRRGHKLVSGDIVEVQGAAAQVVPGCRSGD
jgi:ribosome-associated protein